MKKYNIQFNNFAIKIIIIIFIIIISIFYFKRYVLRDSILENEHLENIDVGMGMELIFFGLGEADSTLIRNNNKVLLIDTGEKEQGVYILNNLSNLGIHKIDYMILTHPDKDHIGGAIEIINALDVGIVIQSPLQKESELQKALNIIIKNKKIETITPKNEYEFTMGEVNVRVLAPEKDYYKKSNDYSLVTLLTHGELNYFFGGDAEKKRLAEVLAYDLPDITLYKVPHHGRNNSKSSEVIEKLSPKVAIITSSNADSKVRNALEIQNTKLYYISDKSIRFLSDGIELYEQ